MRQATDSTARAKALDVSHSFIVTAPAGSGKTTLLVKRYLKLLGRVDAPEEVVAITFTRKAASEMTDRVLAAIEMASTNTQDSTDEELVECARLALTQDLKHNWQLLKSPARIRIQTIDSLSQSLVRQMPWTAGFGAAPGAVADDTAQLYLKAARRAVLSTLNDQKYKHLARDVLLALDNDFARLVTLLVAMLAKRDQWQRLLMGELSADNARAQLETHWANTVLAALSACNNELSAQTRADLWVCARYAAQNLVVTQPDSVFAVLLDGDGFPDVSLADFPKWEALAKLVLTAKLQLRSSSAQAVNKTIGFPAVKEGGDQLIKKRFISTLDALRDASLERRFALIARLPSARYDENEWQLICALTHILKRAVAELMVVFQHQGLCDHIEIATRANLALGGTQQPTDLNLRLDYQISHLLVDEFQDTSHTQIELLKRLSAGWQPGDGRTLFFVGDPMQSIYRFRQADVGIFLNICQHGFNGIPLLRLELSENFRSATTIVDWLNQQFSGIFSRRNNQQSTAVTYSPSTAFHRETRVDHQVKFHLVDKAGEANAVCQLIDSLLADTAPAQRVAVLVRSRVHLEEIVTQLNHQATEFQGIKLQRLSHSSCIQDLLALTRAICHLGDRLSWLAILRAPWCGLDLVSLTKIAMKAEQQTVWQALEDAHLDFDAATNERLTRLKDIVRPALNKAGRCPLPDLVRQVWLALGGADTVSGNAHADITTFLRLLSEHQTGGQILDFEQLDKALNELWVSSETIDARLQLMTIHTAKGLEFDSVILPGLYKKPRVDDASLLLWQALAEPEQTSLLVSSIKVNSQDNRRYDYLRALERGEQREEAKRLLYVACTRAIRQLHLFVADKPESTSLQAIMQNQLHDERHVSEQPPPEPANSVAQKIVYKRLPCGYAPPSLPPKRVGQRRLDATDRPVEYQWAGITAMHLGTLIHEIICTRGGQGGRVTNSEKQAWRNRLLALGLAPDQLDASIRRIIQVLKNFSVDERAKWILSREHMDQHNEWPLTGYLSGQLENHVIDRTFIDNQGVRWIIDYKTSTHEGGNIDDFLDNEQLRYRGQLEKYAAIMRLTQTNPIRLGLYFPMLGAWREWAYKE